MTSVGYLDYLKYAIDNYAGLLPQGLENSAQLLYLVLQKNSNKQIGTLWMGKK